MSGRGVVVSAGFIAAALASSTASAEPSVSLVKATIEAATCSVGSEIVTVLAKSVATAMVMSKIKLAAVLMLVTGSLAGVAVAMTQAPREKAGAVARVPAREAEKQSEAPSARDVGTVFFDVVNGQTRQGLRM